METAEGDICAAEFEEIVKKTKNLVNPGYELESVNDTEKAIREFIKDVLALVEQKVPQLKVSEIILVGSYQEGTKIFKADEFDFLVIIEELSDPDVFSIVTDEDTAKKPGTVKLKLKPSVDADGKWKMYSKNSFLRCFESIVASLDGDYFGFRVIEAIPKLFQNKGRFCFRTNNDIMYRDNEPEVIYCRTKPIQHVAFIKMAEVKFPNVLLEFMVDGYKVSADLCPAIRYAHTEHCFNPENCLFKDLSSQVMNHGSILLVGQKNLLFRVTYTETEINYMNNKMKDKHKSLYIFLKVIAAYFQENWKPMPSYVIKTICIKHDQVCERKSDGNTMLRCFDELMEVLITAMQVNSLTSAFDSRLNLLKKSDEICLGYRTRVVAHVLPQISKLCHNIARRGASQFLQEIRTIIERADEGFELFPRFTLNT